jgi:hypothetical protein
LGPWDLIPDRIPVLGLLDELSYILVSLAIAWLLMPPRFVHHFARQLGNTRDAHGARCLNFRRKLVRLTPLGLSKSHSAGGSDRGMGVLADQRSQASQS